MRREHEATSRKMVAYREERNIKKKDMARRCGVSEGLLYHLESDDWITHPRIAARICKEYRLNVDDYNALVHPDHRADVLPKPTPKPGRKSYHDPEPYNDDIMW